MGAFEFDHKADLSARSCTFCDGSQEGCKQEENRENCIIAQKIFDQCRIQKCLTSDILGPARAAGSNVPCCNDMLCEGDIIIPPCNAADVTIRDLELERIEILRKKPNPLQEGCWDIELKYVFLYTLEFRRADGAFIGCIDATSSYHLRVTLFGSTDAFLYAKQLTCSISYYRRLIFLLIFYICKYPAMLVCKPKHYRKCTALMNIYLIYKFYQYSSLQMSNILMF